MGSQNEKTVARKGRGSEKVPNLQPAGSQARTTAIYLTDSFFTQVLPKIQDLAELKVVLYAAYLALRKQAPGTRKSQCSVSYLELKAELCSSPAGLDEATLRQALKSAVDHGFMLRPTPEVADSVQDVYSLPGSICAGFQPAPVNIFSLYEQNIGIITPMVAEELKEAEQVYPARWIEDAFKEAVALNKRSWRYIARILERWASEGKDSGEHKRDIEKGSPDKYVKGKYGHLVKR